MQGRKERPATWAGLRMLNVVSRGGLLGSRTIASTTTTFGTSTTFRTGATFAIATKTLTSRAWTNRRITEFLHNVGEFRVSFEQRSLGGSVNFLPGFLCLLLGFLRLFLSFKPFGACLGDTVVFGDFFQPFVELGALFLSQTRGRGELATTSTESTTGTEATTATGATATFTTRRRRRVIGGV